MCVCVRLRLYVCMRYNNDTYAHIFLDFMFVVNFAIFEAFAEL